MKEYTIEFEKIVRGNSTVYAENIKEAYELFQKGEYPDIEQASIFDPYEPIRIDSEDGKERAWIDTLIPEYEIED